MEAGPLLLGMPRKRLNLLVQELGKGDRVLYLLKEKALFHRMETLEVMEEIAK